MSDKEKEKLKQKNKDKKVKKDSILQINKELLTIKKTQAAKLIFEMRQELLNQKKLIMLEHEEANKLKKERVKRNLLSGSQKKKFEEVNRFNIESKKRKNSKIFRR
jgi:hypothetical protein